MGEEKFLKLRYCFQAGYTLPQFCIDKGIKRPAFIMDKSDVNFLKELHAQFQYDNRLSPRFCFIDGNTDDVIISLNQRILGTSLVFSHISRKVISHFDAIIFLTKKNMN